MGKCMIIGCGGVASVAIHKCCQNSEVFEGIMIASRTKSKCGLAGIEVYDLLRDEYDIQIEFGDIGNVLAYISVGDRKRDIERLISALAEIKRRFGKNGADMLTQEYISPVVSETPRKAFYAAKRSLPLDEAAGEICSEFVMCYPPGIMKL